MLPGPIFRREVKAGARRRDLFGMRVVLATLMGLIAVVLAFLFAAVVRRLRRVPRGVLTVAPDP